jgi:hypothetical protein
MKNGLPTSSDAPRVIDRVVRFPGKTGKGKISPNTFASILAHPGKPISRELVIANVGDAVSMIWHHLNLYSVKTSTNMLTRVAFPIAAHADRRRGKIEHCSSPLNEGTFSVQTGGATTRFTVPQRHRSVLLCREQTTRGCDNDSSGYCTLARTANRNGPDQPVG